MITSLLRAANAVPLCEGSIASKVSISRIATEGTSLNVSSMRLLYGCEGLNAAE